MNKATQYGLFGGAPEVTRTAPKPVQTEMFGGGHAAPATPTHGKGPGSRGGKVIGYSAGGEPIYEKKALLAEHKRAGEHHREMAAVHAQHEQRTGFPSTAVTRGTSTRNAAEAHQVAYARHTAAHDAVLAGNHDEASRQSKRAHEASRAAEAHTQHAHRVLADHEGNMKNPVAESQHRVLAGRPTSDPLSSRAAFNGSASAIEKAEQLKMFGDHSGEGSRGGKVIGHTSGGKPIYESAAGSAPASKKPSKVQTKPQGLTKKEIQAKGWFATPYEHSEYKDVLGHSYEQSARMPASAIPGRPSAVSGYTSIADLHRTAAWNTHRNEPGALQDTANAMAATRGYLADLKGHHTQMAIDHRNAASRLLTAQTQGKLGIPNTLNKLAREHENAQVLHEGTARVAGHALRSLTPATLQDVLIAGSHAQRESAHADNHGRWGDHPHVVGKQMPPNKGPSKHANKYTDENKHAARVDYHTIEAAHAVAAGDHVKAQLHHAAIVAHRKASDAHSFDDSARDEASNDAWYASKNARKTIAGALHKSGEEHMDLNKAGQHVESAMDELIKAAGVNPFAAKQPAAEEDADENEDENASEASTTGATAAPPGQAGGAAGPPPPGSPAGTPHGVPPARSKPAPGGAKPSGVPALPMQQGADAEKAQGGRGQPEGHAVGSEDHHKCKALMHMQAAMAHSKAAASAKKLGEAKEHGNTVDAAERATQAVAGTPGMGSPGQGEAPTRQPAQMGMGTPTAPAQAPVPPKDVQDQDPRQVAKSWLDKYPKDLRKGLGELRKSLSLGYGGRDATGWASQFQWSPLYERALRLLKQQLEAGRAQEAERATCKTWTEMQDMPRAEREKASREADKLRERHQSERNQMDLERDALEMELIDFKILQAQKDRKADAVRMGKAQPVEDELRKSAPEEAPAVYLRKGKMAIRIDGGDEEAMVKAVEDGRTVLGASADSIPRDGRNTLLGMRGTRLTKSEPSGGTIYEGEHNTQGSRAGDLRESFTRATELVRVVDDDQAGNRGNGGLPEWFKDAYSPLLPEQRVPANMGIPDVRGWQKSETGTVRVLEDHTPYGRAVIARPQEHASSVRMLAQGGGREMVRGVK